MYRCDRNVQAMFRCQMLVPPVSRKGSLPLLVLGEKADPLKWIWAGDVARQSHNKIELLKVPVLKKEFLTLYTKNTKREECEPKKH